MHRLLQLSGSGERNGEGVTGHVEENDWQWGDKVGWSKGWPLGCREI